MKKVKVVFQVLNTYEYETYYSENKDFLRNEAEFEVLNRRNGQLISQEIKHISIEILDKRD